jgi:hypothetical protein
MVLLVCHGLEGLVAKHHGALNYSPNMHRGALECIANVFHFGYVVAYQECQRVFIVWKDFNRVDWLILRMSLKKIGGL